MDHRISAGGIVIQQNKVLLVHHYRENAFDFWVLPGGRVENDEGFMNAAEREVFEETSLIVRAEKIAYIEDFIDENRYVCKFWILCKRQSGNLNLKNKDADEAFIKDVTFFSKEELQTMNVFPRILKDDFWDDLSLEFPSIKYLGYTR